MKKILYILGFLMFATAALQPVVTLGQDQFSGKEEDVPFSSARLFSQLIEKSGGDPNADWFTTFGEDNEEDIGQDLYLIVYAKTENQPIHQANKEVADKYGMSDAEMGRILHSDYAPIIDKKPGLTQDELQIKVAEIQHEHKAKKEMLELKANVTASVESSEIFANGDLEDSGFDLINDLNIIEELLFLKTTPVDIGGAYSSDDESTGTAVSAQTAGGMQGDGADSAIEDGETTESITDALATAESAVEEGAAISTGVNSGSIDGDLNPNECFTDDNFQDSLKDFENKSKSDVNYKDNTESVPKSRTGTGTGTGTGSGTGGGDQIPLSTDFLPVKSDVPDKQISAAQPGEWLGEPVCEDILCLTVNYVKKPATSSFADSDNCIACHVEKINDVLKEVISHSLVPSKAPGNLGESAQCKTAVATSFGSISMNFYATAMPVTTPINDDLIFGSNIEDDWENFCNETAFFPFGSCLDDEEEESASKEDPYKVPPTAIDRATKQAVSQTQDDVTQEELAVRIDDIVTGYKKESLQRAKDFSLGKKADEATGFYHPLRAELDQMNYYFSNIRDILHSLHEKIPEIPGMQACTDLNNKKECT